MEYELNLITHRVIQNVSTRPNKQMIRINYDKVYTAIKKNGYNDFVASQWAILTLSKIYGAIKVKNAVSSK